MLRGAKEVLKRNVRVTEIESHGTGEGSVQQCELEDSVVGKKAGGRRREDSTQENMMDDDDSSDDDEEEEVMRRRRR